MSKFLLSLFSVIFISEIAFFSSIISFYIISIFLLRKHIRLFILYDFSLNPGMCL